VSWETRQQAVAAARREQQLLEAIGGRGEERQMEPDQVLAAMDAAQAEIRRRGQSYEQIMGDLPASPVDCCTDCYDGSMNSDDDTDTM
jgi:hypothetical protein